MIPLKVNFTDFENSPAVSEAIEKKVEKIGRYIDRVTSCEVFVSAPHQHEKKKIYHIHIHLTTPGKEFVVNREPEKNYAHHDIYVAIRDAFDALYRQLDVYADKRREAFKPSEGAAHGRIVKLFVDEGYGFITTAEGRELYFHQNSVLNGGFSDLQVNMEVRYNEEMGDNGPQATSLSTVGKNGKHHFAT